MVKNIRHFRLQLQLCPKCSKRIDSATPVDHEEALPKKGDIAVCSSCNSVLCYGENLELILSSLEEAEAMQPGLRKEIEVVIAANKRARANKDSN